MSCIRPGAAQDLPPNANRALKYTGYYYADGLSDGRNVDYLHEVRPLANLYIALPRGYAPANATFQPALFERSLARAVELDFDILLAWDAHASAEDRASGVPAVFSRNPAAWKRVRFVTVIAEQLVSRRAADAEIARVEKVLKAAGLPIRGKKFGVEFQRCQAQGRERVGDEIDSCGAVNPSVDDARLARHVDYVAVQAYLDRRGSPDPGANRDALHDLLDTAIARVPRGKSVVLIAQSFDRNGGWTNGLDASRVNVDTLEALQHEYYLGARRAGSRVEAILFFAYARSSEELNIGGARRYPALREAHADIAERVLEVAAEPGRISGVRGLLLAPVRLFAALRPELASIRARLGAPQHRGAR
jgi:hypothetical protein